MKKLLILGGGGMLGHKAYQLLSNEFITRVTFRNYDQRLRQTGLFAEPDVLNHVDAFHLDTVRKAIDQVRPDVVLNCIGIIKQLKAASDREITRRINAEFPHQLAALCTGAGARLIHISTDCVFSGKQGNYQETDTSDAEDLYGQTKYLGEVREDGHLTLRTSIIGRELFTHLSLVDWFLSADNSTVNGYVNAIYTGFTTLALCRELKRVILGFPNLHGLYHVSSGKISKLDLLTLVKKAYQLNVEIRPYLGFHCDRSLQSQRYQQATGFSPPPWKEMIEELRADPTPYGAWKSQPA